MKKLLLIFSLLFAAKSFAQYPLVQGLGNDSTLIKVGQNYKGGIKGGLINMSVADTTAANLLRIKAYPGAQIYTDDGSVWIRNITATGWILMGGGSSPSGSFWRVGGNEFPITIATRDIGTGSFYGGALGIMTNGIVRAIVPNIGFTLSNDTTNTKIFTINPTTKEWGYANWNNGGGGATPTLQQVLAAGRTLASNDSIIMGGYVFKFKGGKLVIGSTGTDAGDYSLQNTGGVYFDVTGKYLRFQGVQAGEVDTVYGQDASGNVGKIAVTDLPGSVNVRRSIEKGTGDSLQLVNDVLAPGSNKIYGTNESGVKGYNQGVVVDTTGAAAMTLPLLKYDVTDSVFKVVEGNGSANLDYYVIPFKIGTTAHAPANGDSTFTRDTLIGKYIKLYRNGLLLTLDDTVGGYEIDSSIGKITYHPPDTTGEQFIMQVYNNWPEYVGFPAADPPPPSWQNLTFTTRTGGMTAGANDSTWNFSGSGWNQSGLADQYLPAGEDGMIRFKYNASPSGQYQSIGFKTSNSNGSYTTMTYGAMINPAALYPVIAGSLGTPVYTASVGDYIVIRRTGITVKIQTTTDNITYTDRYTFAASSSSDLYIVFNVLDGSTGYFPKCYNCQ